MNTVKNVQFSVTLEINYLRLTQDSNTRISRLEAYKGAKEKCGTFYID